MCADAIGIITACNGRCFHSLCMLEGWYGSKHAHHGVMARINALLQVQVILHTTEEGRDCCETHIQTCRCLAAEDRPPQRNSSRRIAVPFVLLSLCRAVAPGAMLMLSCEAAAVDAVDAAPSATVAQRSSRLECCCCCSCAVDQGAGRDRANIKIIIQTKLHSFHSTTGQLRVTLSQKQSILLIKINKSNLPIKNSLLVRQKTSQTLLWPFSQSDLPAAAMHHVSLLQQCALWQTV